MAGSNACFYRYTEGQANDRTVFYFCHMNLNQSKMKSIEIVDKSPFLGIDVTL